MERVLIFLGGVCVGSFLNILIYRLPRGLLEEDHSTRNELS